MTKWADKITWNYTPKKLNDNPECKQISDKVCWTAKKNSKIDIMNISFKQSQTKAYEKAFDSHFSASIKNSILLRKENAIGKSKRLLS